MATAKVRTSGGVSIEADFTALERGTLQMKQARKALREKVRDEVQGVGEQEVLPAVRMASPSFVKSALAIRSRGTTAQVVTRLPLKRDRVVGLLEFGGLVTANVLPKSKQAVVVAGQPVAAVTTPRRYKGKHRMMDAVRGRADEFGEEVARRMTEVFGPFARA